MRQVKRVKATGLGTGETYQADFFNHFLADGCYNAFMKSGAFKDISVEMINLNENKP